MSFRSSLRDALWAFKHSRKAKVIILILLVVVVAAFSGYVLFGGGGARPSANDRAGTANTNAEPTKARRAIDGVFVDLEQANNLPFAVVVENLVQARPQAGLDKANVVYEALAEGGITRFLAVYAGGDNAERIGPVRSARPYFLDWVREYDALFAHAGGSPEALKRIPQLQIRDLNQFGNGSYFWRDTERRKTLPLEHTLYTSTRLLSLAQRDQNQPLVGTYTPWQFADDPVDTARPSTPQTVTIDFSTFNYKVTYQYDRATNSYERLMAEKPHTMEDGTALHAKNVVVLFVPASLADDKGRLTMQTTGEGKAVVFHSGAAVDGVWKKASAEDRTMLYDATGQEMTLTAGATWVEIVPNEKQLTYH